VMKKKVMEKAKVDSTKNKVQKILGKKTDDDDDDDDEPPKKSVEAKVVKAKQEVKAVKK